MKYLVIEYNRYASNCGEFKNKKEAMKDYNFRKKYGNETDVKVFKTELIKELKRR